MKNVIILITLLLGTCRICIADSKMPKLIIPKGYEVVYDANNKPYFVKAQTTLEKVVKHDKPENNSLTKVILQSLNTTPQKCYVWDTKEAGYEYGRFVELENFDNTGDISDGLDIFFHFLDFHIQNSSGSRTNTKFIIKLLLISLAVEIYEEYAQSNRNVPFTQYNFVPYFLIIAIALAILYL